MYWFYMQMERVRTTTCYLDVRRVKIGFWT